MDINNYEIILTDSAKIDLEEIYEYISENLLETNSANRLMEKIENDILRLEQHPYSCIEVQVKPNNKIYRKFVTGKYIVLYQVDDRYKQVIIFNVIYGKRDYLD